MIKKLINNLAAQRLTQRREDLYRNLIRQEAKIGGQLFGEVPDGHRREFFCLDQRTWIWHEEWEDTSGHHVNTTRYDVRPDTILKSQNGQFQAVTEEEARRLEEAAGIYLRRIKNELYQVAA